MKKASEIILQAKELGLAVNGLPIKEIEKNIEQKLKEIKKL